MKSKFLFAFKKLAGMIVGLFVLSIVVFAVARLAPGDPLMAYYGDGVESLSNEERLAAEERLGLNDSMVEQYVRWAKDAVRGNFGLSYKYKQDVVSVVNGKVGNTLLLGGVGFVLIFLLALLLGMLCARYEDSLLDKIVCKLGTIINCIPEFWMSLILIFIFSVTLKILPSGGVLSLDFLYTVKIDMAVLLDRVKHLIMPLFVVVMSHLWYYTYIFRNKFLEEIKLDYVILAMSKGLRKRDVFLKHCLKNVMPTYLSMMAISVMHVLSGTYIVENIFSYPGLGMLAFESARMHDYNLLMFISLISGVVVFLFNTVVQIVNEHVDERISNERTVNQYEE